MLRTFGVLVGALALLLVSQTSGLAEVTIKRKGGTDAAFDNPPSVVNSTTTKVSNGKKQLKKKKSSEKCRLKAEDLVGSVCGY